MFLVSGAMEPEPLAQVRSNVEKVIQQGGGTITTSLELERRRLAYKIHGQPYGYYFIMQFNGEPQSVRTIDQKLRLDNDILRHLCVKALPRTAEEIKNMVAGEKYKIVKKEEVPVKIKTSVTALTEEEKIFAEAPRQKVVEVKEEKKISMEELDKKLDAILEDSDLTSKL